jgi:ABC-type amino acid transport substrate-binding protein
MIRALLGVLTGLMTAVSMGSVEGQHALSAEDDLPEIQARGVLYHLGIPYANFVTGAGDGLDVELMRRFAEHIGVEYRYVETSFSNVIADLTGNEVRVQGNDVEVKGAADIRGDIVASGYTILPWREQLVDFSIPTFPTGVWLIARAEAAMEPIRGSPDQRADAAATRSKLSGLSVLSMENTCLDPDLNELHSTGAEVILYDRTGNLNELVPAVLRNEADTTILDVPDALIALDKWPGEIKVIGPISEHQTMGVAFRKTSPKLRAAFDSFFSALWTDGSYEEMVMRYYPSVFLYFSEFFER